MPNALVFILRTLVDLYLLTFALRLLLQWSKLNTRNPLVQFLLRVTNPLVVPLRRVLPPIGRFDSATGMALLGLQLAATMVLIRLGCIGEPDIAQVVALALLNLVQLLLRVYLYAILVYVILSWVSPGGYNPATALLAGLVEPVLAHFRRFIPTIGGLDLSPLFAMIAIQALTMTLPIGRLLGGLLCTGFASPAF